jgi:hypothetical protein
MSIPNPPRRRRYAYRRYSDERIWREFFCACIVSSGSQGDIGFDAALADKAYAEYRNRFPAREPEVDDDEPAEPDTRQAGKGVQ